MRVQDPRQEDPAAAGDVGGYLIGGGHGGVKFGQTFYVKRVKYVISFRSSLVFLFTFGAGNSGWTFVVMSLL